MSVRVAAIVCIAAGCFVSLPVHAAESGDHAIDWSPALSAALAVLAGVIGVLGRAALRLVERFLNDRLALDLDEAARRTLETAFANALAYGRSRIDGALGAQPVTMVRSELLAAATQYVVDHVPDALTRLGLDRSGIERRLEARLATQTD